MNELVPIQDGKKTWQARRPNFQDTAFIRAKFLRERIEAFGLGPGNQEAKGVALSKPVRDADVEEYRDSVDGMIFMLYNCVHDVDATFTMADAYRLVHAGRWIEDKGEDVPKEHRFVFHENPDVERLYQEGLLSPPVRKTVLPEASSGPVSSQAK